MNRDDLRSSVRPILTYIFAGTFAGTAVFLIVKFADSSLAGRIAEGFITITGMLLAFWFGSRTTKP